MKKGERFINFRPFLFLFISVAIGIGAGYIIKFKSTAVSVAYCLFAFLVILTIFILLKKYANLKRYLIFIPIALFVAVLSCFSVIGKVNSFARAKVVEREYTIEGTVVSVDDYGSKTKVVLKDLKFICEKDFRSDYNISIMVGTDVGFLPGYKVSVNANVLNASVIYENKPSITKFNDKIRYTATVSSIKDFTVLDRNPTVFGYAYSIIDKTLKSGLSGNEYAIALGMMTGNSSKIETRLMDSFRHAGVAHIFAVSGLHIGVIAGALGVLLKLLPKGRRNYFAPLIALFCLFYSGVCGFSSSSLRAVIMFSTVSIVKLIEERYDALSSLSIAGFITLLFMPFEMFSAGFLLSYSAAGFIIVLSGAFKGWFKHLPEKFSEALAVATGAFLGGLPICISFFGYTSVLSVLLNVLVLPFISFIFVLIFATTLISALVFSANFLYKPAEYGLSLIIKLFKFIDFGLFTVNVENFKYLSIIYYAILIIIGGLINLKRLTKIITVAILTISFALGSMCLTAIKKETLTVVNSSNNGVYTTLLSSADSTVLIVNGVVKSSHSYYFLDYDGLMNGKIDAVVFMDNNYLHDDFIKALKNDYKIGCLVVYNTDDTYAYGVPIKNLKDTSYTFGKIKVSPIIGGLGVICNFNDYNMICYSALPKESVAYYTVDGNYDFIASVNCSKELSDIYAVKVFDYGVNEKINGFENDGRVIFKIT